MPIWQCFFARLRLLKIWNFTMNVSMQSLIRSFCATLLLFGTSSLAQSQEVKEPTPASVAAEQQAKTEPTAKTSIQIERVARKSSTPTFKFENVPSPSKTDAGNIATATLVRGTADRNGAGVLVVLDGKLPEGEDQPDANYFLAGRESGRLLFDFGKPIAMKQINTYSWHASTRANQKYEVYVPAAEIGKADVVKSAGARELPATWNKIAAVDSRSEESTGAQIGVSISGADGKAIATTQFVLLAIEPNDPRQTFGQTFFSELDFVDGESYPAPQPMEREKVVDDLVIDDKVTIHFDTTETPDLREWVRSTLMPACEKWYPRLVEALPSDGYRAPTEFKIVFRDNMRGVAYTSGKDVYCAGPWYRANLKTEAVGSVIHELVHVVQQYGLARDRRPPGWLVEGVADHVRWYQFEPVENRRRINWERSNFDDAYFPSATFLDYIVRKIDPDAIQHINADCRQGRYSEKYWEERYEKSAEQIWEEAKNEAKGKK